MKFLVSPVRYETEISNHEKTFYRILMINSKSASIREKAIFSDILNFYEIVLIYINIFFLTNRLKFLADYSPSDQPVNGLEIAIPSSFYAFKGLVLLKGKNFLSGISYLKHICKI